MASLAVVLTALAATAAGLPSPQMVPPEPGLRILPRFWGFNITSLTGPGCPNIDAAVQAPFSTRPTYGSNTVDGSEIYYWHFAYPSLRAAVGPGTPAVEASTWCETTLSYNELDTLGAPVNKPEYRLQLHKNGTAMQATYELDEGVVAKWKFTYYPAGGVPVVDTIDVAGPISSSRSLQHNSAVVMPPVQWALPDCGTGTVKFRTELTVSTAKENAKGFVASEVVQYQGKAEFYGVQQGVSYDFEKCAT